jgi:putative heme-binding domain-containing protein
VESRQLKAPANAESKVGDASHFATGGHTQDPQTSQQPKGSKPDCSEADVLRSGTHRLLSAATRLAGLWKLTALAPQLKTQLAAADTPLETKRASVIALARLNTARDLILKLSSDAQQPLPIRLAAVEALALSKDASPAAKAALSLMSQAKTEEEMRALLAPFVVKAGRVKPLVAAINESPCSKEAADLATRALIAMGRNEPELSAVLNRVLGRTGVVMPYDAQWVSGLGNEATVSGNAKRGDEIFHRPALNCIACHQINNQGGIIGPQLDAVGRGVPVELIVEAVMWPQRQIKEGYVATTVVMKDGRTLVGYKVRENESELTVRDMATKAETTLQKSQMQTHTEAGSLMPDGLTASLSREELRDLIAYLASLGKEEKN